MHLCCLYSSDCLMVGYSHASKLSCEMCLTSSCHSVYCDSRWKCSGCWSSQRSKRHNFQTICRRFCEKNAVAIFKYTASPWKALHSAPRTMSLYSLCDMKARRTTSWSCGVVSANSCYMTKSRASDMNMGKSCRQYRARPSGSWDALGCSVWSKVAISFTVVRKGCMSV